MASEGLSADRKAKANAQQAALCRPTDRRVECDLPDALALLPGEGELVHQYLGDLLTELFADGSRA